MDESWNGPDPENMAACPYSVDFKCRATPARELNSLESGRLLLTVDFGNDVDPGVQEVSAILVNKAKAENHGAGQVVHTMLSAVLVQDSRRAGKWVGELSIPVSWMEGSSSTYERTGAWMPKSRGDLYAMEITYRLAGGSCTARFASEDAFHWTAREKPTM
jgi:hypothetical protein